MEVAALSSTRLEQGTADRADNGWENFTGLGISDEENCREYFTEAYDGRLLDFIDD